MKSYEGVLSFVASKLEHCGIAYMIVGSFASNRYGLSRATHDADLIVLKNRPFDQEEFRRRQLADLADHKCWFATAEDTILAKLEWSKMGESERQFLDAVNVAKVQKENLDFDYLRYWANELQVTDLFDKLLYEIKTIS